ncbi:MAG: hypothetical protein HFE68_02280 [Erysipelotrichaceae bacterium]|nr:hypothetical protein [Erysipelotrichaceae bacterium]MCI9312173.1 hypothetical protein [Erysipelotrichaceae bacterium]
MSEVMEFIDRDAWRAWLSKHSQTQEGVWLIFYKKKGTQSLKPAEALEEALCFGWIDGQMKRINEDTYQKYFSLRRAKSKWSDKNKKLVKLLEEQGRMSDEGRAKVAEAKQNGQWDALDLMALGEDHISELSALLKAYEPAYSNFQAMSLSVQKTYARAYYDAKTEAGRKKRIAWMVERLNQNLKPM